MLPHLGVHRGREDDRAARRQQDGGEQVIGPARGGAGHQVSRSGRDNDQVGFLAEADVRNLVHRFPRADLDRLAR